MTVGDLSQRKETVRDNVTLKVLRASGVAGEKSQLKGHLLGYVKNEKKVARLTNGTISQSSSTEKRGEHKDKRSSL